MHQTKPIEPTWNHCHGARIATSAFRLSLPIILSNKLIVMPVQIFIMNQLTGRFSIGSISRKHFPIWRNNRQAFRNDAGTRVDFFFFFFLFFFSNPRTITLNERSLFAYNRLLSNRQISVSIVRSNRYRMLEWKFRSVENRWWKEMERKRGRKRNGDKNQPRPFLISLLYFWSKSILRVMSTSRNL